MFVRTNENRLLRAANWGNSSEKRRPGVRVAMVEKGPRYSDGALGLGSNMSTWLGPPPSQMRRIDLALGASAAAKDVRELAKGAASAARTNVRRVIPWQSRVWKLPT